jgi:hypothetical protein
MTAWWLVLLCSIPWQTGYLPIASPRIIEIDGARNPELIPDYMVWEFSFRMLARTSTDETRSGRLSIVKLSTADTITLYRVADEQLKSQSECLEKIRIRNADHRAAHWASAAIDRDGKSVLLQCRQESLDAADALLASLSPAGRTEMTKWIQEKKKGIAITLLDDGEGFWRRPR